MNDTPQPCAECGEDPEANGSLRDENTRLHAIVEQYENSILTHRKLMLTQIEKLAKLRA
ncbi:MAG: hypothetical protein HOB73_13610 [Planctomycetaceae bacterium]|jgi:hypothetical protein|nr:hypothetical protein [Planctomycetaceae bacterium]